MLQFLSKRGRKSNRFVPPYDKNEDKKTGNVNAGDVELYIGGGTLNGAFADEIINMYDDYKEYSWLFKNSKKLHSIIYRDAEVHHIKKYDHTNELYTKLNKKLDNLFRETWILKSNYGHHMGTVYLHLFDDKYHPYDNEKNKVMIYVVPPRIDDESIKNYKELFDSIKYTSKHIAKLVNEYNNYHFNDNNKLDKIRISLFSGGAYLADDIMKIHIAENIILGVCESIQQRMIIEFAPDSVDTDNYKIFEQAYYNVLHIEENKIEK